MVRLKSSFRDLRQLHKERKRAGDVGRFLAGYWGYGMLIAPFAIGFLQLTEWDEDLRDVLLALAVVAPMSWGIGFLILYLARLWPFHRRRL